MRKFDLRTAVTQQTIGWLVVILMMMLYAAIMSHLTVLRYDTFKATAFDLGNMDQAVWNTLHGRPFEFTNQGDNWYGPPTRLAQHVEPIMLPLSLLYLIHADPRTLLVFQSLALATGALPVFLLTRKHLPTLPLLAPVMAAAYLLMPALIGVNVYDFHPVALATPLLLYAVLALTYKRYVWFVLTCILASSCKEDVPTVVAMFCILVIWKYKLPRLGTILLICGISWTLIAFLLIEPHFSGAQHNNFWYRYAYLGSTPQEGLLNILRQPWLLFQTFITTDRLYYLFNLFRSTGFLVLLAPEWLLPTLPNFAINLLSGDKLLYSGAYQYNAPIIPFIMLSAIHGAERLLALWHQWRGETAESLYVKAVTEAIYTPKATAIKAVTLPLAFVQLASMQRSIVRSSVAQIVVARPVVLLQPRITLFNDTAKRIWQRFSERIADLARTIPLPRLQWYLCIWMSVMIGLNLIVMQPKINGLLADHKPGSREQHIQQLLDMIPPDAPIAAGSNLNPHLSERRYITVFPTTYFSSAQEGIYNTVQYIIVDLDSLFPEDKVSAANILNQLVKSQQFRVLKRAEGVILLVKNTP